MLLIWIMLIFNHIFRHLTILSTWWLVCMSYTGWAHYSSFLQWNKGVYISHNSFHTPINNAQDWNNAAIDNINLANWPQTFYTTHRVAPKNIWILKMSKCYCKDDKTSIQVASWQMPQHFFRNYFNFLCFCSMTCNFSF